MKTIQGFVGAIGAVGAGLIYSLENTISASAVQLHGPKWPWPHNGIGSLDHMAIRRGYEVFKNVCSACHGMKYVPYRRMIGVFLTETEAKREAAEVMYTDGPDDEGMMFERPGKISDYMKNPYENVELAKLANNGNEPPDLSLMALARDGGESYIFSLLTGYCDAPAGVQVPEGTYYNPYFGDGAIGMAPPLYNEILEYSDGTPASLSQCAKDVSTFITWTGSPEHDYRKRVFLKVMIISIIVFGAIHYWKRVKWNAIKTRQWAYFKVPPKPKRAFK